MDFKYEHFRDNIINTLYFYNNYIILRANIIPSNYQNDIDISINYDLY